MNRQTFQKTITLNKFDLKVVDSYLEFDEYYGYSDHHNVKLYLNTNNSGSTYTNFMNGEERYFENQKELLNHKEELGFKYVGVLSLYQENGYIGVHIETEMPLVRRPNNWVQHGRNGNLYVIYTNDEKLLIDMKYQVANYINYGLQELILKDNEDGEWIDGWILSDLTPKEMEYIKLTLLEYGLTQEEIDEVGVL